LGTAEAGLTWGIFPPSQKPRINVDSKLVPKQCGLIESALPFARAVKRYRHHDFGLEAAPCDATSKLFPEGSREGDARGILQVMDDATHRIVEEIKRTGEVEGMVAAPAGAAPRLDRRRRHAALKAKGLRDGLEFRPAFRASDGPPPLADNSAAENTRLRKKEIQDRVDHANLSSTQRAKLIYFE
jgi:hypothetical protein